jgi:NitT/TauT family transport system ATP-binding protein
MTSRRAVDRAPLDPPPTEHPEFEMNDVTQYFLDRDNVPFLAVQGIDLSIYRSEFVCIIGPSGCGKSTLLNMMAGLLVPTEGLVSRRGEAVTGINTSAGYLTQNDHLLPWHNVEKNVSAALRIKRVPRAERAERVSEVLELVGLSGFAKRYPDQLSGGMRKRAALARLLVYDPDTLLMDEPFAALDAQLRTIMQQELLELWGRRKKTVAFVTHDLEEAILLADRVVVFGTNPGHIVHIETIDLPRPRPLEEIRNSPEFNDIWRRLWDMIKRQIARPRTEGEAARG